MKESKKTILLVHIDNSEYGIHTSSIEAIREFQDASFSQNLDLCRVRGEKDESEEFPVLNFRNIKDDLNKRSIDPELARIIIVRENNNEKKGVIVVDTILDLINDLSERNKESNSYSSNSSTSKTSKIKILEITKAFMTLF